MERQNGKALGLVLAGLTGLVALVGCGSGGGSAATDTTGPVGETRPAPTTIGSQNVAVVKAQPDSDYCRSLDAIDSLDAVQGSDVSDAAQLQAAVESGRTALSTISGVAPEAVAAEWTYLLGAFGSLFDAYEGAGYDAGALMGDVANAGLFEQFSSQQFTDSADAVETFTWQACGVHLGLGDPGDATTAEAPTTSAPALDDATAGDIGAALLDGWGIEATPAQQTCVGQTISTPQPAGAGGPLDRYREILSDCGLDATLIPG